MRAIASHADSIARLRRLIARRMLHGAATVATLWPQLLRALRAVAAMHYCSALRCAGTHKIVENSIPMRRLGTVRVPPRAPHRTRVPLPLEYQSSSRHCSIVRIAVLSAHARLGCRGPLPSAAQRYLAASLDAPPVHWRCGYGMGATGEGHSVVRVPSSAACVVARALTVRRGTCWSTTPDDGTTRAWRHATLAVRLEGNTRGNRQQWSAQCCGR